MKNRSITSIFVLMLAVFNSFANQVPQQGKHVAILPFTVKGELDALYTEAGLIRIEVCPLPFFLLPLITFSYINKDKNT